MTQSHVSDLDQCTHSSVRLVKFLIAGERTQITNQCLECGERVGNWLPQAGVDLSALPWENQELRERTREERRLRAEDNRNKRRAGMLWEQFAKDVEWRQKYDQYLKSEHWHNLRRIVLRRDDYLCQNCFRRVTESSAHVHHISYDSYNRKGYSFAFECVSLCFSCHTDFHNTEDDSIPF